MTFVETCLDKVSRITQNPNLWHSGKRLWRFWLKQLYSVGLYKIPAAPLLKNWDGKTCIQLRPGEHLTRRLWFLGYYEYNEDYFLRTFIRQGMTVIDVGANIGHITTICGLRVGPSGAVHSFEPATSTFEFLKKNISINGLDNVVTANKLAVSNKSGDVIEFNYCYRHSHLNRLSDGKPETQKDWQSAYEKVSTITLDDYVTSKRIARVDFLKMDIEGAELLALAGANKTLEDHRPTVLCEINPTALQRLGGSSTELWNKWMDYGYAFFNYNHRKRTLIRCKTAPQEGAPTYVGTTDPEKLVVQIGARIL